MSKDIGDEVAMPRRYLPTLAHTFGVCMLSDLLLLTDEVSLADAPVLMMSSIFRTFHSGREGR